MVAILDFLSETFQLFLIFKSPWCFLPNIKSIGLSVQEKKWRIDFQDGGHGSHLGCTIWMILDIFDLLVTPMLPTKLQVNWPFFSEVEVTNRISRWQQCRISDRNDFDLLVTLMLPTKFQVNCSFSPGEEAKNKFSRLWPLLISDWKDFSYFLIYKSPRCFLPSFKSNGLSV